MIRTAFATTIQSISGRSLLLTAILVASNMVFNVIANTSFKYSAMSQGWRGFLGWQIAGNLAGLATVITLTALLRHHPLNVAFPVTTGLAVIGVQVLGSRFIFHEPVTSVQWLGTLLVVLGIALIGSR